MRTILTLSLMFLFSCASYKSNKQFELKQSLSYGEHHKQQGDLYLSSQKNAPIVFTIHGGGWSNRSREDMSLIAESLASHGINVFNINYRLAPKHKHPSPIEDLARAIAYIEKNYSEQVDMGNIGLWGYSSGAHTALLYALDMKESVIRAIVAGGGPYDLTWWPKSPIITPYMGYERDKDIQGWIDASPINHLSKNSPAIFLYHGEKDELVDYEQMTSFGARAKLLKLDFESHLVSFWGHANTFIFSDVSVKKGIIFLKKRFNF